jgi:hypothetical protein
MLVQDGEDRCAIGFHDEVDSVWKTVQQAAANRFLDERKLERVLTNPIEQDVGFCQELGTDAFPLLLISECGGFDIIPGLWWNEWEGSHQLGRDRSLRNRASRNSGHSRPVSGLLR